MLALERMQLSGSTLRAGLRHQCHTQVQGLQIIIKDDVNSIE